jgi:Ca2+-binding RTX toxin-like protein
VSEPAPGNGRAASGRRVATSLAASAVVAVMTLVASPPAAADASCSRNGTLLTVNILGATRPVTIARARNDFKVSGPGIVDPTCGGATMTNTDHVIVDGSPGTQSVVISGRFEPGATAESTGLSEIEFTGNLEADTDMLTIKGTGGNDAITWGTLGVNLNGDDDADVTIGSVENRSLLGGDGGDVLSGAGDNTPPGIPMGQAGNDTLVGGNGNDALDAGDGDDLIGLFYPSATDGADTMIGGPGSDQMTQYFARVAAVVVSADGVANDGEDADGDGVAEEGDNVAADFEFLDGGTGDDTLTGSSSAETLFGGLGDDALHGGGGADTFVGYDTGADVFDGGPGSDSMSYGFIGVTNPVVVSLDNLANDGQDTDGDGLADEGDNVMGNVESVTGSEGNDMITGSAGADTLNGIGGNDVISGLGGNDSIGGWVGDDQLFGNAGDDVLDGSIGMDLLNGGAGTDFCVSGETVTACELP